LAGVGSESLAVEPFRDHCSENATVLLLPARRPNQRIHVVLVPPAPGLVPVIKKGLLAMAQVVIEGGYSVAIVSFPGQPGNVGVFSVAHSCVHLRKYLGQVARPCAIFGICSGAVASMSAAVGNLNARGVFCWDLAPEFRYTEENVNSLQRQHNIAFCPVSSLIPVQASALANLITVPTMFAFPPYSHYTTAAQQRSLARRAMRGRSLMIHDTGHIPGVPRGSERVLATVLLHWLTEITDGNTST
jgi:hypothetical protein